MSQREKQIEGKISQFEGEKKILQGIKVYYEQNLTYHELEEITGVSMREFKRYQQKNEYPYFLGAPIKINDVVEAVICLDRKEEKLNQLYKQYLLL